MTDKRFAVTQTVLGSGIYDFQAEDTLCESYDEDAYKEVVNKLNELNDENQMLKEALLFFVDVANSQCSSNWRNDMENDCQRLFNCSYEEAKEKYDDYDGSWWELGL